ncbi:nucleotide-diphospho-sugar transferase [Spirosoma sp. RP8]|uniref:Nucleotide-diphospho-sugar transferase n=1 Tax=Spirosoma liriopis TaxID=2937440 RepID=A0ABT0HSS5_9BACT|nr:nucleotide-diphospho-sugar transferase [Spirosoma liriopis]MCK8494887.1 nucleotide-diphospho-sugar transferase [Spirosoma liriopis]
MQVPILFIIFNKREETKRVFNVIRSQQPKQLFIAADGPRVDKEGEVDTCRYVREWVLGQIDWECEVNTRFLDQNIGCGRGPSKAISWFFEHVNEGIILEDDCLPNEAFFRFSAELLERYRNDSNISIISGNNFQPVQPMQLGADYYFSLFPSTNGWATWKRSWDAYEYHIASWPTLDQKRFLNSLFREKKYQLFWKQLFDWAYEKKPDDTWDIQFHYHCMKRNQLAVIPAANLISNIGYGPDATHSKDPTNYFANVPTHDLAFPVRHPGKIQRNYEADEFIQNTLFGAMDVDTRFKKFKRLIKRIIRYKQTA